MAVVEERAWGYYIVLDETNTYKIKKVIVSPGQKLSLQLHYHRSEHWVVVSGMAQVELDEEVKFLRKGESTFVSIGMKHCLGNPGIIPLEVIEVEIGEYLKEDDIIRFKNNEHFIN